MSPISDISFSDFGSELTELSSDEEYVPLAAAVRNTRANGKGRDYSIKGSLRPPRTSQFSAKALYDQIVENTIDLDPEYQRDVVWPETKQSGLIDSLLHNYYVPPIIFATDDGDEKRTCIDGKQRLTSIQRFMDGMIPHKDSFTNQKMWYKGVVGQNRKILPDQYRKLFANKQIVCVEYDDLDDDQEREIFQRVQLGVALTPAERMQAITSPWSNLIREIQNQVNGEEGFEGYLDWGHTRGRDFQCLSSIGYLIDKYPKQTNPTVVQLEKWLSETKPIPAKFREGLLNTFRIFVTLARDKQLSIPFRKPTRVSPAEFVMIGLLINIHSGKMSLTQLSSAVEKLRGDVRGNFIDIRMNTRTMKHMYNFIATKVKSLQLKSDGKGDLPAAIKPPASKRKRVYDSDDEEVEASRPRPAKGKAAVASTSSVKAASTPVPKASSFASRPPQAKSASVGDESASNYAIPKQQMKQPLSPQMGKTPTKPSKGASFHGSGSSSTKIAPPQVPPPTPRNSSMSMPTGSPKGATDTEPKTVQPPPRIASRLAKKSTSPPEQVSVSAPSPVSHAATSASLFTPAPTPAPNPSAPVLTRVPDPRNSAPSDPLQPVPTRSNQFAPAAPQISSAAGVAASVNAPMRVKSEPQDTMPMLASGMHVGSQAPFDRLAPLRAAKAAALVSRTDMQGTSTMAPAPPLLPTSALVNAGVVQNAPSMQYSEDNPLGPQLSQANIEELLVRNGLKRPSMGSPESQSQAPPVQASSGSGNSNSNAYEGSGRDNGRSAHGDKPTIKPSSSWSGPSRGFWPNRQNPLHSQTPVSPQLRHAHAHAHAQSTTTSSSSGGYPPPRSPYLPNKPLVNAHVSSSSSPGQGGGSRSDGWGAGSGSRSGTTNGGGGSSTYAGLPPPPISAPLPPTGPSSHHEGPYAPRVDRMRRSSEGSSGHAEREQREYGSGGPRYPRGFNNGSSSISNSSLGGGGSHHHGHGGMSSMSMGGLGREKMHGHAHDPSPVRGGRDGRDREWERERERERESEHDWGGDRGRTRGRGRGGGRGVGRGRGGWEYPSWGTSEHRYGRGGSGRGS